jgi:hypothetical protein
MVGHLYPDKRRACKLAYADQEFDFATLRDGDGDGGATSAPPPAAAASDEPAQPPRPTQDARTVALLTDAAAFEAFRHDVIVAWARLVRHGFARHCAGLDLCDESVASTQIQVVDSSYIDDALFGTQSDNGTRCRGPLQDVVDLPRLDALPVKFSQHIVIDPRVRIDGGGGGGEAAFAQLAMVRADEVGRFQDCMITGPLLAAADEYRQSDRMTDGPLCSALARACQMDAAYVLWLFMPLALHWDTMSTLNDGKVFTPRRVFRPPDNTKKKEPHRACWPAVLVSTVDTAREATFAEVCAGTFTLRLMRRSPTEDDFTNSLIGVWPRGTRVALCTPIEDAESFGDHFPPVGGSQTLATAAGRARNDAARSGSGVGGSGRGVREVSEEKAARRAADKRDALITAYLFEETVAAVAPHAWQAARTLGEELITRMDVTRRSGAPARMYGDIIDTRPLPLAPGPERVCDAAPGDAAAAATPSLRMQRWAEALTQARIHTSVEALVCVAGGMEHHNQLWLSMNLARGIATWGCYSTRCTGSTAVKRVQLPLCERVAVDAEADADAASGDGGLATSLLMRARMMSTCFLVCRRAYWDVVVAGSDAIPDAAAGPDAFAADYSAERFLRAACVRFRQSAVVSVTDWRGAAALRDPLDVDLTWSSAFAKRAYDYAPECVSSADCLAYLPFQDSATDMRLFPLPPLSAECAARAICAALQHRRAVSRAACALADAVERTRMGTSAAAAVGVVPAQLFFEAHAALEPFASVRAAAGMALLLCCVVPALLREQALHGDGAHGGAASRELLSQFALVEARALSDVLRLVTLIRRRWWCGSGMPPRLLHAGVDESVSAVVMDLCYFAKSMVECGSSSSTAQPPHLQSIPASDQAQHEVAMLLHLDYIVGIVHKATMQGDYTGREPFICRSLLPCLDALCDDIGISRLPREDIFVERVAVCRAAWKMT